MSDFLEKLDSISEAYQEASKQYEKRVDDWWDNLSVEDREFAFYSVVKRIYEGEIKQECSYRYILYQIFGFDAGMYGVGMDCGFLELHNAIKSKTEEQILQQYYKERNEALKTK